jgi:hypothetical protein
MYGDDLNFFRDRLGYVTAVPTRWTTIEIEDPFLIVSAGRSHFRVQDLIDLASLISEIQSSQRHRAYGLKCKVDYADAVKMNMPVSDGIWESEDSGRGE